MDEVKTLRVAQGDPAFIALNPSGTHAAIAATDGRLIVVDWANGAMRHSEMGATSLAFGREGLLAVGTATGKLILLTGADFACERMSVRLSEGEAVPVSHLLVSASGNYVAAVTGDKVALVDALEGHVIGRAALVSTGADAALAFDREERTLAVATSDLQMGIMDTRDGRVVKPLTALEGLNKIVTSRTLALNPGGTRIAFNAERVHLYDVGRQAVVQKLISTYNSPEGLTFAADGAYLVGYSKDELRIWKTADGKIVRAIWAPSESFQTLAVASDAARIAAAGKGGGRMVIRLFGACSVERTRPGFLGVRYVNAGATRVAMVMDDTAASRAGIREDDVITSIGGKRVTTAAEAAAAEKSFLEGAGIDVELIREGTSARCQVKLTGRIE